MMNANGPPFDAELDLLLAHPIKIADDLAAVSRRRADQARAPPTGCSRRCCAASMRRRATDWERSLTAGDRESRVRRSADRPATVIGEAIAHARRFGQQADRVVAERRRVLVAGPVVIVERVLQHARCGRLLRAPAPWRGRAGRRCARSADRNCDRSDRDSAARSSARRAVPSGASSGTPADASAGRRSPRGCGSRPCSS